MSTNRNSSEKGLSYKKKIEKITFGQKPAPKFVYAILLIVYILASVILTNISRSQEVVTLFGSRMPLTLFNGVLSSLSDICILLIAFLFGKVGFITAIALLVLHFPNLILNLFFQHNVTSIPGIFRAFFTALTVVIIYWTNKNARKFQKKLMDQTLTDPLTGLPSRFACTERMNSYIKKDYQFVVVSIDLNNFKAINDTMGHATGDKVIAEIANRLKTLSETSPDGKSDFLASLGGDVFCLLIRDYECDDDIIDTIRLYESEIKRKITIDGYDYFMTANFGYAEYLLDADNESTLYSCADAALHEIKRSRGENNILRFSTDLMKTAKFLDLERRIRVALHEEAFLFYLQPQFDMSHKLRGFEALARLKDQDGNIISPNDFIPVAEEAGLIDRVDLQVFKKAACFLGKYMEETGADLILSTNISVRHLMKNNFTEEIQSVIRESGIPAKNVELEITESIMIDSAEEAMQCINRLKSMGITMAIDDFGTGYSSLSYLNKIPVDTLKIDKAFITPLTLNESSKKYVEAIISIGHILNFKVISEGVETPEQLEILKSIGCDYIQGFIWGKTMPPEQAIEQI
ncbi:MAG: bifunctional diguanylate cyclase/phosphodiesterase, partial [Treponema sp.]|nr:bifunctional diguanylate cyclase/phosphodiesterase [Treponema sp.]